MVREKKKFFKVREKPGNFILSPGKLIFWRKVTKNWNNLSRLIKYHWRSKETIGVTAISTLFLRNEEGKFVENFLVLNERMERTTVNLGQKLPLNLIFCIYLVRGIFYQGILRSDTCDNYEGFVLKRVCSLSRWDSMMYSKHTVTKNVWMLQGMGHWRVWWKWGEQIFDEDLNVYFLGNGLLHLRPRPHTPEEIENVALDFYG